jgi:hypothetical protein
LTLFYRSLGDFGYQKYATGGFTTARGFGWTTPAQDFERGTTGYSVSTVGLYCDGAWAADKAPRTFQVAVTPGTMYDVRIYVGDRNYNRDNIQIRADGVLMFADIDQTANTYHTNYFTVTPAGSVLNITISDAGGDPYWLINGLDIAEAATGLPPAAPLTLSEFGGSPSALGGSQSTSLTAESLAPIVSTAIAQWQTQELTALQAWRLNNVEFRIAELASTSPHYLGLAGSRLVLIDDNAAGYGWSLDVTRGPAAGQVDLLSAVMHELGHVLGYDHSDDVRDVMFSSLSPTLRPSVLEPFSSVASRASDFLTPSLFASSNSTRLSSSQPFTARDQLFTRLGKTDSLLTESLTPRVDESHEPFVAHDRTTDRRVSRAKRHHDDLFAAWDPSEAKIGDDVLELLDRAHGGERED